MNETSVAVPDGVIPAVISEAAQRNPRYVLSWRALGALADTKLLIFGCVAPLACAAYGLKGGAVGVVTGFLMGLFAGVPSIAAHGMGVAVFRARKALLLREVDRVLEALPHESDLDRETRDCASRIGTSKKGAECAQLEARFRYFMDIASREGVSAKVSGGDSASLRNLPGPDL